METQHSLKRDWQFAFHNILATVLPHSNYSEGLTVHLRVLVRRVAAIALGSMICNPFVANAQVTFEGCKDINGVPVASVRNDRLNDIAMASILNGRPVIIYNSAVVASVSRQTRLFFYAHECGHHALGHVLSGLQPDQEQQADCWGVNTLVEKHKLSDGDITRVQADLFRAGKGDWTHLPGPQRAINLRECLASGSNNDDDGFDECMEDRIERCMDSCQDDYGHSRHACQTNYCNPNVGSNRSWAGRCRR